MDSNTRSTIAYIAGKIISNTTSTSLYDSKQRKYIEFSGTIDKATINIYNFDVKNYYSGNYSGDHYSIYSY